MRSEYADGRISFELREGVALIGLNDAERLNPFSVPVIYGLEQAVSDALTASHEKLIFFGHGESFSSGADMEDYQRALDGVAAGDGFDDFYRSERALIRLAQNLRLPHVSSVCAVHGWVVGQGFETALACDFIVAEQGSRFWMPETRAGWNAGMGTAQLLVRSLGLGWARRMLLLNEKLEAERAADMGLVTRIAEPGKRIDAAIKLLGELEKSSPRAFQFQKKILDIAPSMSLDDSRELEVITGHWLAYTSDVREAAAAFVEKRPPRFKGH